VLAGSGGPGHHRLQAGANDLEHHLGARLPFGHLLREAIRVEVVVRSLQPPQQLIPAATSSTDCPCIRNLLARVLDTCAKNYMLCR
jgi:hypothetical protein